MSYKMMKVFDLQDMPKDIKMIFYKNSNKPRNDCYVEWAYKGDSEPPKDIQKIEKWFEENGANDKDEYILVKFWW